MGNLSLRPQTAIDMESGHEPCVLLKYTSNTAENHQTHRLDEIPVGAAAAEIDGGREEKKRKKSFWKWPALRLFRRGNAKYDLAQVEKNYREPGSCGRFTDASEVWPAAEEQLEQDVLDTGDIRRRYKIGDKLGQGRFGFVCQGSRCKDGLEVAVKFSVKGPNMPYIRVPGHPESLPMEIGLMLMVNTGPNVPQVIKLLDWQDDTDHYIMVMERPSPCMDLSSFIKLHGGSLDEAMARQVMQQVIDAAIVCSKRGVFHRDIKLENLLLNRDTMEVKLIDFKCAALMKKFAYEFFCGTRAYCPPEVSVKGRYHAKPMMVWSLGVLLFKMVCGYYPTDLDLHLISEKDWTRPELSRECCQMICACLEPEPQQRLTLEKMGLHDWFKVLE
ncbi:serine/threonine-protein kinase pim-2-like [Carassius carassius]|uniref:serine/threonine-protein kinase pim-2-like n=1 Tax=Carassius carassius TaxID=217509 RepID=UPI00286854C7|nr:serine/threonine-protein kinase pim-2-like [Carassius carassius]